MRGNMNMDVTPKWLQTIKVILSMKWLEHMTLQIRDTWVLICAVEVSMTQLNLKPAGYYESSENSAFWTIVNRPECCSVFYSRNLPLIRLITQLKTI